MSVRAVKTIPQSVVRAHMKKTLRIVNHLGHHVLMTHHGKGVAGIIPMSDLKVLWQLQKRPVSEMEHKLKTQYPLWLKAKRLDTKRLEAWDLGDHAWVPFWCFEKM